MLGIYAIGDPDGWGNDRRAIARRVLVCVHALLVLAGLELALWQAAVAPGWLATVTRGLNVFVFPVLALALFKAFPSRLRAMLEAVLAPLLYGGLIVLTVRLLGGRDPAELLAGGWLREELILFALPYAIAAAAALSLLLVARLGEGSRSGAAGLRRALAQLRDEPFLVLFWIVLLLAWWSQLGFAVVRVAQGFVGEPWYASAACAAELALATWRLVSVTRRGMREGV